MDTNGWKMYEVEGEVLINPIILVQMRVKEFKNNNCHEKDLHDLIVECIKCVPGREQRALDMIAKYLPQFKEQIAKYNILF